MFKTAATKIAHNSTLPALGGNQDLRPLQDLITAEKSVLIALQKLSVDYSKASEALRTWGLNEGDDLGDILSASTTILNHFSSALSQYASHGHTMREQLKAIRTREEALEDLKRRRRSVARKAEDADKKLSKMSPEHKNLVMQTETLNRLRDEIRTLDSDIMTEEAAMADFKRTSTRMWMGLKFGGLSEMCEKGAIVAEFGKMIIGEISEEITQPGLPRSLYYGHSKTENYVAEAHRCINEVTLSTVPSVGFRDRRQYEQRPQEPSYPQPALDDYNMNSGPWTPTDANKPQPPPPVRIGEDYPSQRTYQNVEPISPAKEAYSSYQSPGPQLPSLPTLPRLSAEKQSSDDFGMNTRTPGLLDSAATSGGRFATFPVKRNLGTGLSDLSSPGSRNDQEESFSASIAAALDGNSEKAAQPTESSQPSWLVGNKSYGQAPDYSKESDSPAAGNLSAGPPNQTQEVWAGREKSYGASYDNTPTTPHTATQQTFSTSSSLPPPPPGAAPPDLSDPWANTGRNESLQPSGHMRNVSEVSGNDALLAYMTTPHSEPPSPMEARHPTDDSLSPQVYEDEQQRISRHVRWGEVQDVEQEMIARQSLEQNRQDGKGEAPKSPAIVVDHAPTPQVDNPPPVPEPAGEQERETFSPTSSTSSGDGNKKSKSHRVPPPTFESEPEPEPQQDEQALNAAAAREITRELEALKNSPPKSPMETQQSSRQSPTEATADRSQLPPPPVYNDQASDNSSLPPPSAPFANRAVSPYPYGDINVSSTQSTPYLGGYTGAQSYAQAYQGSYGSAPSSPAQAYAQAYQASQAPDPHPTSTIPPRFQALNQEMQVPPRFQGRNHSPGSANSNQLPPRFQNAGAAPIPPTITLPDQQLPQDSRFGQGVSQDTPPYRTPPEYPRLGNGSPYTRSTTSLTAGSPVGGNAPRTISASAFKRPRNQSVDNLGGQGDPFKRTLPSSPYPASRERDMSAASGLPAGAAPAAPASGASLNTLPPGAGPPGNSAGRKSILDDDEFDYISAYVNSAPSSPLAGDFEQNGQGAPPGAMTGVGAGGRPAGAGYGDGRYPN